MSEQRPSPDKLLQRAQKEEREGQHGKLKIYLDLYSNFKSE